MVIKRFLTPDSRDVYLRIPENFIGKKIEIIAFAADEIIEMPKLTMADFWGTISDETAAELHKTTLRGRGNSDVDKND